MIRLIAFLSLVAIAGCDVANDVADQAARAAAKEAVNEVVAQKFPGVNAAPVTDCVIDNASAGEIVSIARDSTLGNDESAAALVLKILERPATIRCIASNSADLLQLGQLM